MVGDFQPSLLSISFFFSLHFHPTWATRTGMNLASRRAALLVDYLLWDGFVHNSILPATPVSGKLSSHVLQGVQSCCQASKALGPQGPSVHGDSSGA